MATVSDPAADNLFVATLSQFYVFEHQFFLVQYFRLVLAFVFPGSNIGKVGVVALGFTIFCLEFFTEVATA